MQLDLITAILIRRVIQTFRINFIIIAVYIYIITAFSVAERKSLLMISDPLIFCKLTESYRG